MSSSDQSDIVLFEFATALHGCVYSLLRSRLRSQLRSQRNNSPQGGYQCEAWTASLGQWTL